MKVVLDTDPGIDDAVALMLALASPELDLVGVTTTGGNVGCRTTFENAHRLLRLFNRTDIPVGIGMPGPREHKDSAKHVHGDGGLGETNLPLPEAPPEIDSVELLCELARRHAGELHLVAVGPLTNLARALAKQPALASQVASLTVMGGAVFRNGNITPAAEFNIYMDPEAAAAVFDAGWTVRLVPLDATTQPLYTQAHLDACLSQFEGSDTSPSPGTAARLCGATAEKSAFYRSILEYHIAVMVNLRGLHGCYLHDALAVASLLSPEVLKFQPTRCVVETRGEHTDGMTLCDFRRESHPQPNALVALDADSEAFFAMLHTRIANLIAGK